MHHPLRLTPRPRRAASQLALAAATRAGVAAGAAVKADGYGLGAREVMRRLAEAGCRDFFVSTWAEAEALGRAAGGREPGRAARRRAGRRRGGAGERLRGRCSTRPSRSRAGRRSRRTAPCDVMIDTGMNRLGLRPDEIGAARRARRSTRCTAISPAPTRISAMNAMQLRALSRRSRRRSRRSATASPIPPASALAATIASTSSGRALRSTAAFRAREAEGHIRQVARLEAEIVQRRTIRAGESCGYGATFTAERRHRGGDRQHRLCRRLSARLLVARARPSPANSRCRCSAACRWT